MFRHILVPATNHPASAHAAQQAYRLTRALGGRVTLLWVLSSDRAASREEAQAQLQALAAGARRPPATALLSPGSQEAAPAIAAFAARSGADLIVLGVGGDGSAADDAQGTLALALAANSGLPVQLACAPAPTQAAGGRPWQRVVEDARRVPRAAGAPGRPKPS
ncbi:universal stress protein [Deinococcus multiflagellatus]|uniref:Universal stress protein n=1 Tax=Deinococcus multiflagellatus TaxID=1656887 RepID=A0ABW1ZRC4_9DEIO|nr:universal stress protein [Deinococcus multiflagellatus]MBZ9713570.1 universal stress protein [Deinococcus multiflagellatus]